MFQEISEKELFDVEGGVGPVAVLPGTIIGLPQYQISTT